MPLSKMATSVLSAENTTTQRRRPKKPMSDYCVYKHTTPSGKVYIGITRQKPERRWRNGEGYKPPEGEETFFYNAICQYGWENISHEIIAEGLTKEAACELEIDSIKRYKAQDRKYGYNVLKGGDIPLDECPNSVKEKMSRSALKKWERPEYIKAHLGDEHWTHKQGYNPKNIEAMRASNLGRKRTPEQIEFLREKGRNQTRHYGKDNKKSIPILCISKSGQIIGKYYGAMEAERKTGVCFQNIFKVCNGERKTAGGYIWQFAEANE